jgi:hypothetical protein
MQNQEIREASQKLPPKVYQELAPIRPFFAKSPGSRIFIGESGAPGEI